jgi:hypothetical protein
MKYILLWWDKVMRNSGLIDLLYNKFLIWLLKSFKYKNKMIALKQQLWLRIFFF